MDLRERSGHRSVATDRSIWRAHVEADPIAALPIRGVERADARAWFARLLAKRNATPHHRGPRGPLSAQTCRNALNLVRVSFHDAMDAGLLDVNPFHGLRVPRSRGATTRETWTVLARAEQEALLWSVPEPDRWIVAVALGTGLRQSELWSLRLVDVDAEGGRRVVVRYGRGDRPTKGGRPRTVPLFGLALDAMRAWLGGLAWYAPQNPHGLAFPTRRGCLRDRKPPAGWHDWVRAAGIGRRVRWHDLRHACASSLVGGWWGRVWSLEEVRAMLGHSSVQVTERYAHFADDVLVRAARETDAVVVGGEEHRGAALGIRTPDLRFTKQGGFRSSVETGPSDGSALVRTRQEVEDHGAGTSPHAGGPVSAEDQDSAAGPTRSPGFNAQLSRVADEESVLESGPPGPVARVLPRVESGDAAPAVFLLPRGSR